jgi:RNA polymerase primary sigma factor
MSTGTEIDRVLVRSELVKALAIQPGSSARDLARILQGRQLPVDRSYVNSVLYSNKNLFWNDRGTPPRWQVLDVSPPSSSPPLPQPRAEFPTRLFAWQAEALNAWRDRGWRGIVEAVTGTGKTTVGLYAAWQELQEGGRVEVLVPSKELLYQWFEKVMEIFPGRRVGVLGDGRKDRLGDVDILIAVVNSARELQADSDHRHALLIADECHRYATECNARVLDETIFDSRLGLSATYARTDNGHLTRLDPFFGGTCYEMGYSKAIADEVTAHFKVALVGVNFNSQEHREFCQADERARQLRRWLIKFASVQDEPFGVFMADVSELADGGQGVATRKARAYLNAFSKRRQILAGTQAKRLALNSLVPAIECADKTLVFTEQQDTADEAAEILQARGIPSGAIHAGLSPGARQHLLWQFRRGSLSVLCAPRVLDEGVDVPAADLGIILAASRTQRQMIQRMGRVLRKKRDGRLARFVIAYVAGTSEDRLEGAHGAFLEEVTEVADDVVDFRPDVSHEQIVGYLNDFHWNGPIPQPRFWDGGLI